MRIRVIALSIAALFCTGPATGLLHAVQISSFDRDDPQYEEKRDKSFCFAKRILE